MDQRGEELATLLSPMATPFLLPLLAHHMAKRLQRTLWLPVTHPLPPSPASMSHAGGREGGVGRERGRGRGVKVLVCLGVDARTPSLLPIAVKSHGSSHFTIRINCVPCRRSLLQPKSTRGSLDRDDRPRLSLAHVAVGKPDRDQLRPGHGWSEFFRSKAQRRVGGGGWCGQVMGGSVCTPSICMCHNFGDPLEDRP